MNGFYGETVGQSASKVHPAEQAYMDRQASASQIVDQPPMREQLFEIEKILADAGSTIQMGADALFGSPSLKGSAGCSTEMPEESIATIIRRIRNQANSLHSEAMRFNRIG